jgi:hypothetical protein
MTPKNNLDSHRRGGLLRGVRNGQRLDRLQRATDIARNNVAAYGVFYGLRDAI